MRNQPLPDLPRRMLMGPGPSEVHPRVLAAMARPTIGHLDPAFVALMDDIKRLLRYAFRTANDLTIPLSAPGSAGMECCFVNLIEPGDTVIVCANGVFGGRMKENVERCGAKAVMVEDAWGQAVDPDKVKAALAANPGVKAVAFVHAETSTGVRSDAAVLCGLARGAGALSIVDTVTGLAGIPVDVDAWGADAVYSGTQKCLSCPPGLSPITFSARAVDVLKSRKTKVQSWFLDLSLVIAYWGDGKTGGARTYHHTAPVNALYGLHEALLMLEEEGLEAAWKRHATLHGALVAGLEAMGLRMKVDAGIRLPQLNAVEIPAGIDEAAVRRQLLAEFNLEIGAGLGAWAGKVWRIGLMGQSATPTTVLTCLAALESALQSAEAPIKPGFAQAAARAALK
jgi:alanine-glyoxylate transaminase/serine-glyoxylate transaminase/serine-pyruvate transaminase